MLFAPISYYLYIAIARRWFLAIYVIVIEQNWSQLEDIYSATYTYRVSRKGLSTLTKNSAMVGAVGLGRWSVRSSSPFYA